MKGSVLEDIPSMLEAPLSATTSLALTMEDLCAGGFQACESGRERRKRMKEPEVTLVPQVSERLLIWELSTARPGKRAAGYRSTRQSVLEEPQPEILGPGAVGVAHLKPGALRHRAGLILGKRHAVPGIAGRGARSGIALHLEFEERPGLQQPMHFAHVVVDHVVAGDVLKDDGRVSEVELDRRNDGEIAAVVLHKVDVGTVRLYAAVARATISPLTSTP